ncbi:NlpC/P60 family protein [Pararhizobium sp. IMCC21322]|uniref:C40 family peptidase n=1 Tax=Pararhizobium sp. IMCC21322 TaxID=3067903 RepID=UPI00274246EE|nr:NlpC/P60 family protein [Pararhizobium sp. IMCC21322]
MSDMSTLDRRLHAFRDDLADERLKDRVDAANYVAGTAFIVSTPTAPIHRTADSTSTMETEALMGETFTVFDQSGDWCWGQLQSDNYVGYMPASNLISKDRAVAANAQIVVQRSFVYPKAELRDPPLMQLSMCAQLRTTGTAETRGTQYQLVTLPDGIEGAVIARHVQPLDTRNPDWVSYAEQFLHVPYLWGGRSSIGLDCSALVQIARQTSGKSALRDSDMQGKMGRELELTANFSGLQRGDLIFWPGHVAIMLDATNIIHTNGFHMATAIEPLAQAEARIAAHYGKISHAMRPD